MDKYSIMKKSEFQLGNKEVTLTNNKEVGKEEVMHNNLD